MAVVGNDLAVGVELKPLLRLECWEVNLVQRLPEPISRLRRVPAFNMGNKFIKGAVV